MRKLALAGPALLLISISGWAQFRDRTVSQETAQFRQLLEDLSTAGPTPCDIPTDVKQDTKSLENSLFEHAAEVVATTLNIQASGFSACDRASSALQELEQMSANVNSRWSEDNRFHFEVFDFPPTIVIKLSIRDHEAFFVFAITSEGPANPEKSWRRVGSDENFSETDWPPSRIDLYALHRGPSGNARFLARIFYYGCAGSYGVKYDAREWNPDEFGGLYTIIKQEGSFGLEDAPEGGGPSPKHPFAPIGRFLVKGPRITLPYCWFSPIDTWDNPSMCAVDTYNLSGDDVKFASHAVNRPDLLPGVMTIEHASHHDYPAVAAYCASATVARKLVHEIPNGFVADQIHVTRFGDAKERIEMGFPETYLFEIERRKGQWLVVSFGKK